MLRNFDGTTATKSVIQSFYFSTLVRIPAVQGHPLKHCQAANPFSRCPGYSAASFSALLVWNPTPGNPFSSDMIMVHCLEESLASSTSQEVKKSKTTSKSRCQMTIRSQGTRFSVVQRIISPLPPLQFQLTIPTSCGTSPLWNTFCAKV